MTVLSHQSIARRPGLIVPLRREYKCPLTGMSGGLSSCGYDVALAEDILLGPCGHVDSFKLASTQESFSIPPDLVAKVHDKSSWARRGLAVQNTVIEPGWYGFLTLELTNHSAYQLRIFAGTPVAQVLFELLDEPTLAPYRGKYQGQKSGPQEAL